MKYLLNIIISILISLNFAQSDQLKTYPHADTAQQYSNGIELIDTSNFHIIHAEVDTLTYESDIDIFESQIDEAKMIFSEAIISDLTGDTLEAMYQFDLLFESMANLDALTEADEFQNLDLNRLITAAIDYYENQAVTLDKIETGLSVAMFRDKLDRFIYSQTLEDLEFVEEKVEIIPGHVPITYNQKVASIIKFFQNQGRTSIQKWLNRVSRFKPIILPILESEGVPSELFYLAMIESGLNPKAYSYAHASGVWQFISSTGKIYGLKKNWWIDERRDYEKSTRAAARYLKDLYKEFDDWYLAFAAYNCGSSRVKKAIKRNGSRDYWKLTRLPAQTRNYVPNIMAAIFIANDPVRYGFAVIPEEPLEWTEKSLNKSTSLETLSKCAGIDINILQLYNPELRQGTLPPMKEGETYLFRMPSNANISFDSLYADVKIQSVEEIIFVDHKVRRGESLWLIARKYGVRVKDLVTINKLSNERYIRPGQIFQIPTEGYTEFSKSAMASSSQSKKIYYTVKRGDTLSEIAMKYRTSIRKIKKWNGLRNDRIYIGQKLKLWTKT